MRQAIPAKTNLALTALCVAASLHVLFVVPLILLPIADAFALTLIPSVLMTTTNWAIMHEAFHDKLHTRRRVNNAAGRALGWLYGAPFIVLRFGHLVHHRLDGTAMERSEAYDPARTGRFLAALIYYPRLFFGMYAVAQIGTLLFFLPRPILTPLVRGIFFGGNAEAGNVPDLAVRRLVTDGSLWQMRLDGALALAVTGLGFAAYGAHWPLLALVLIARGFLISFHDNAYHYGAPLKVDTSDSRSSYDLRLPDAMSRLILNFNLHGVHHRYPALPWPALPFAFASRGEPYDGALLPAAARQLRGPVATGRDQHRPRTV